MIKLIFPLVGALLLSSCAYKTVTIVGDSAVALEQGKTLTLSNTTTGSSFLDWINWTSSDTSVATVDSSGVVTAVSYGTTTIKAASDNDATVSDTMALTVYNLKISNNSGYDLQLTYWGSTKVGTDPIWDTADNRYYDGISNAHYGTAGVAADSQYVYFYFANSTNHYHTSSMVTVSSSTPTTYTLLSSTLVVQYAHQLQPASLCLRNETTGQVTSLVPVTAAEEAALLPTSKK